VLVVGLVLTGTARVTPTGVAQAETERSTRPSIVLIVTDDQRADTLAQMPAVRRDLVRHGVVFTNAFASNSLCCPSRASILTGRYSHSTRVYRNDPPFGGWDTFSRRGEETSTIATHLRSAGYRTALVGKYLNGYGGVFVEGRGATYVPPGWDRWVGMSALGYYNHTLTIDGSLVRHGVLERDYSTDVLARHAVAFIRSTRGPLFLYFAPFAPHAPTTPARRHARAFSALPRWRPPNYNEADVSDKPAYIRRLGRLGVTERARIDRYRRNQLRALLAADDAIAEIVRALRNTGRLQNTLIVFTSDNGVAWGEHRLAAGRKGVPYDEATRVPLVVRYDPWTTTRPRTDDRLILNLDFAETFAAIAQAGPWHGEGRSFLPLLRSSRPMPWRHDFLLEHLRGPPQREVPSYCGLRSLQYLYVAYETGEEELYDLEKDPNALQNVARVRGFRATASALRNRLRTRLCVPPPPAFAWRR
jgi:arylsulfatase A-like enzyme